MKYAVIKTGGKQYKVTEGQVLEVERLSTSDKTVTFSDVLLVSDGASVQVGTPFVPNVVVSASVTGDVRGEKIRVAKYKAKVRYRRVTGHRQALTRITIDSIGAKAKKTAASDETPVLKPRATRAKKSASSSA